MAKIVADCGLRNVMGIPVKVNADSGGKPNGVPLKANSRRSDGNYSEGG
jgi:hypothetical protein